MQLDLWNAEKLRKSPKANLSQAQQKETPSLVIPSANGEKKQEGQYEGIRNYKSTN